MSIPNKIVTLAAIAGAAVGGAAIANAAGTSTATTPSSATSTTQQSRPSMPAHGTTAHESQEKPVTGANADKAKAAALKSVGSGTAGEVTTDFTGDGYEVTVTKADGSKVEVHLDSSFAVNDHGGPGGHGAPDASGY